VYLGLVGHKQEFRVVDIDVEGVAVVVVGIVVVVVVGDSIVVVVVVEIADDVVVGDSIVVVGSLGEGIVVGNIVVGDRVDVGGDDIALLMVEVTLLLNIVGFLLNMGAVGNIDHNNLVEHLFLGAVNHPFQYCFDCFDLGNPYIVIFMDSGEILELKFRRKKT
jgi:hypothetical protein